MFRVGTDQIGQYLDIEVDLRHAPLIINESGMQPEHQDNEYTMRETTRQVGVRRPKESRYRSSCMRLSYLAQDRSEFAEAAKQLVHRVRAPREFHFIPLKRAARYLVWKPKAALRFRRQGHVDKITVFANRDFAGDPVSRKSTTGLVAQIGTHTVKSGSTLLGLTALSVGEAEF